MLAREPQALEPLHPGERVVSGDLGDAASIEAVVAGADAVISAVGPTSNSPEQVAIFEWFARVLVAAMDRHGVRRAVALSGAGVTAPGESKRLPDRLASAVVKRVVRHVVEAKQRELDVLAASGIEWIAPRPTRVVEGAGGRPYRAGAVSVGPRSTIASADLADFMVRQLTDDTYLRQAPFITY